jgi:hypothetical protein
LKNSRSGISGDNNNLKGFLNFFFTDLVFRSSALGGPCLYPATRGIMGRSKGGGRMLPLPTIARRVSGRILRRERRMRRDE